MDRCQVKRIHPVFLGLVSSGIVVGTTMVCSLLYWKCYNRASIRIIVTVIWPPMKRTYVVLTFYSAAKLQIIIVVKVARFKVGVRSWVMGYHTLE